MVKRVVGRGGPSSLYLSGKARFARRRHGGLVGNDGTD
jgi:hypothetical protein